MVACGLDRQTGEVFERRLCPDHREILEWIGGLPHPVAVTYEAGPTGFGLARALEAAEICCVVAAPSKLVRPAGDRVKTDARDARHLARLLHLDQIVAVTVPSMQQEAARDLVRAREDCRADLMRTRHRLSKLLLRQGIVYYGGEAWNAVHERWLRRQHFDLPQLRTANVLVSQRAKRPPANKVGRKPWNWFHMGSGCPTRSQLFKPHLASCGT